MLEQVERHEYHSKVPAWIRKLMKKEEKKLEDMDRYNRRGRGGVGGVNGGGGGRDRGNRYTRRQFRMINDRAIHVPNSNLQYGYMFELSEQFRNIFHPGNMRNFEKPKAKNGIMMCLRFHTLGFCFGDYKYKDVHKSMDTDEARYLCTYIAGVKGKEEELPTG